MIELSSDLVRALEAHAVDAYPDEACGFLVGKDGEVRRVARVERTANVTNGSRATRYDIDPREILRVDREARNESLELLGFYHSHPDHPARPSSYDTERAWPWYSYLILSVRGGKAGELRAWRLEDEAKAFREEKLMVAEDGREVGI
jgi:proteasome lid subunit RPN8/RPN11